MNELEGKLKHSGTSPEEKENDLASDGEIELSNVSVPTEEEKVAANLVPNENEEEDLSVTSESEEEVESTSDELEESCDEDNTVPESTEAHVDLEAGLAEGQATKMFSQAQVDEIAGKSRKEGRERALRDIFSRYGVNSEDELDELFGDSQRLVSMQDEFDAKQKAWEEADLARTNELNGLKEQVAFYESGIDKDRYDDAKFILKGKGLDVTSENILQELATHPEWKKTTMENQVTIAPGKVVRKVSGPATKIDVLGNARGDAPEDNAMSEYERAMKMYRV